MKGFAVILLCLFVAVQGRAPGARSLSVAPRTTPALGENPWIVHLRFATTTGGGVVSTAAGSLITTSAVLTGASSLQGASFIWVRYGVVQVIRPQLVTETSSVTNNPGFISATGENNLAIVNINTVVETSAYIQPIPLDLSGQVPNDGQFCAFGAEANGAPGEELRCIDVILRTVDDSSLFALSEGVENFSFDIGAPLVVNGQLIGVLTNWPANFVGGNFLRPSAYASWITERTGLDL